MRPLLRLLPLIAIASVSIVACGGDSEQADETVSVAMLDTQFAPNTLSFPAGTTVKFDFVNRGQLTHEAVFGDQTSQEEHEQEMRAQPHMHVSKAKDFIELNPGDSGDLVWTFDEPGTTIIGCHNQEPGSHWDQGMKIEVNVTEA